MGNGLLKLFRIGGVYLRPEVILQYCDIAILRIPKQQYQIFSLNFI